MNGPTLSGTAPVINGEVDAALSDEQNVQLSNASVGLVAFVSGLDLEEGRAVALAGIQSNANIGAPMTGGVASYNAEYQYTGIANVERTNGFISGIQFRPAPQNINLTADFDAGTLTGARPDLTVRGSIAGTTVSGSATVRYSLGNFGQDGSVNTDLNGFIGSTGVIATMTGSNGTTTVAGGMVGVRN